jgi:hypothetical protein
MDREEMGRRNREGGEDAWLPRGKEKCWVRVAYFYEGPTCHREEAVEAWELGITGSFTLFF